MHAPNQPSSGYSEYINAIQASFASQIDALYALINASASAITNLASSVANLTITVTGLSATVSSLSATVSSLSATVAGIITDYMPKSGGTFTGPVTLSTLMPTTPSDGIVVTGKLFINNTRPVVSGGFSMTTNPTPLSNTMAETTILGAGVGSLTLSANSLGVGAVLRGFLSGYIDTAGSPTITFRVYAGPTSNVVLSTIAIAPGTISLVPWRLEIMFTVRAIGSGTAGKVQMNSFFVLDDTSNAKTFVDNPLDDIDTTIDNVLNITAQWSVASNSNILHVDTFNTMYSFFV